MGNTCMVCSHEKRKEIDLALVDGVLRRLLMKRYKLSKSSLIRHQRRHIPKAVAKSKDADDMTHADDLIQRLEALLDHAKRILVKAEKARQYRAAVAALREMIRIDALLLEVRGELDRHPQINLVMSAQWVSLRTAILAALEPYPGARATVTKVLTDATADA